MDQPKTLGNEKIKRTQVFAMPKMLLVANVAKEHIRKFHIPLITLLKEKGWTVDVACRMDAPVPECDHAYDLPCDRDPFRGGLVKSIQLLKTILRNNTYDVLLCNTIVGAMIGRAAAAPFRKNGLKVFYLNHGLHFFPGASLGRWALGLPMEKLFAGQTDMMITINASDCATAQKYLNIPMIEQIHGMGCNLQKFQGYALSADRRNELRAANGIGADDFVMTYVAEVNENKNQAMLLEMFTRVRQTVPEAKLVLVGPEHDNGALRGMIQARGVQDRVLLLGWRDDIPALLKMSDVYVASSWSEGLGINLIEAMACDLPVVATKNRGHAEIVDHGVNGFLVELDDGDEMADCVLRLHDSPALRRALVTRARTDIQKYETNAAMQELADVIERNLKSQNRGTNICH